MPGWLCSGWKLLREVAGVEGFEGPSRLLRRPQHLIGRNPEDVDVVPSMKRYGWPFPEDTKKYVERFIVLAFGPVDRYNPHRQTKPPVAVAVAVAAMMLVWSDRGQWEQREECWAPVARPYHVRPFLLRRAK